MQHIQTTRQQLRHAMRIKRLSLTQREQNQAALSIIPQAIALIEHYRAARLAFYLPFDGEISPLPLIEQLKMLGKQIYLPVLHPFSVGNLLFLAFNPNALKVNRFGILEPQLDVRNVLPVERLEMIFTPLVACDKQGNRMGMGGGFYDRTFAQSPHLIRVGLAHRCQQVAQLPVESWDQPLTHLLLG